MTNIRRFLKQIRLEHGEVVKDMSKRIGVSISFLCAVERGTRKMPKAIRDRIAKEYDFTEEQEQMFDKAIISDSNPIKINIKSLSDIKKALVLEISEKIDELSDQVVESLLARLREEV